MLACAYPLPGYDLLKGPMKQYALNTAGVDSLLKQAQRLADNLKVAFDYAHRNPRQLAVLQPAP